MSKWNPNAHIFGCWDLGILYLYLNSAAGLISRAEPDRLSVAFLSA